MLGHRYYDASTGRFLTRDPVKDGRNWFTYCDGNPITFGDPNGFDEIHLIKNEGVPFIGNHLIIGLKRGNRMTYYGFYPDEKAANGTGSSGGSSDGGPSGSTSGGSTDSSNRKKGRGPGYIKINDIPSRQSQTVVITINERVSKAMQKKILISAAQHEGGSGGGYNVKDYNCSSWVVDMLGALYEDESFEGVPMTNPTGLIQTPDKVLKHHMGSGQ